MLSDVHLRDAAPHIDDPALVAIFEDLAGQAPGRLVLNGDFFDFVKVTAVPGNPDEFERPVTPAERFYGLGTGEDRSAWKAARILDANPRTVAALRDLVASGHEIVFLPGNHDAEVRYPAVRAEIAARIDPAGSGALSFPAWFYHEPGRLWVEHGSQYDRENVFPDFGSTESAAFGMPFGIVSSRYFANVIERRCGLPPSDMGPGGYFVWVFRNHGLRAFAAIARYFVFAAICLLGSGPFRRRRMGSPAAHKEALRGDAMRAGIDTAAAVKIDALKADPLLASLGRTVLRLYLPQVSLTVASWMVALAIAVFAPGWWVAGVSLVAGSTAVLALSGRIYTGQIRPRLEDAAGSIAAALDIPCVVFGHDHNGIRSRATPENFASSVWRFGSGPARILEIPPERPVPHVLLARSKLQEERT